MSRITLSTDEIEQITRKTQPAAQIRKLKAMGIRCFRTDDPEQPVTVVREWLTSTPAVQLPQRKPQIKSERGRVERRA